MPSPSDVGSSDLYGSFQDSTNAVSVFSESLVEGLQDPTEAEGWIGILIPAVVTGLAVAIARKVML